MSNYFVFRYSCSVVCPKFLFFQVLLRITANSEIANVEFEDIMEIHAENLAERALLGLPIITITI